MFEKVNPSHPDKVADRIAGAIVDLAYTKNKNPKVAVEVLLGHGKATVMIESSEDFRPVEIDPIVRRLAGDVELDLHAVKQDQHLANNQEGAVRCGDNGIFKGSAPTYEQKALTAIAASIYDKHPFDGKYIIQGSGRLAAPVFDVTVCQSHLSKNEEPSLRKHLIDNYQVNGNIIINPLGEWTGGPDVDCGATNRKLGSDMGDGVTGGGLHGKDLSKADVSVNIWCYLESIRTGHQVTACCSIGDESVNGVPYADIVEQARLYIHTLGGFEKFAEWGLIRPLDAE
jgi:S-adenosylmethionine synthetase